MSAIDKEKIFVELRKYHTEEFPGKLATEEMINLREEFQVIEDEIVTMLLNLVNGKAGYVDFKKDLSDFAEKIKVTKTTEKSETDNRNFFKEKIEHLLSLLQIAEQAVFRLKIPRAAKIVKA